MIAVSDVTFGDEVLSSKLPVIVVFGASWCAPCRALKPEAEKLAAEFGEKVKVVSADIEEAMKAAQANGVRGVPTLVAFARGEVVSMAGGGVSPARLREFVSRQAA